MDNLPPSPLGITVMPEWFQCEGVETVLDRLQRLGVGAIATSPYLMEPVAPELGAREPPADGEAGRVRPLDRPLWGQRETWVRTAPSYQHDYRRYEGCRYQPSPPQALTDSAPRLMDEVIAAARARGIAVFFQIMAASPPGYRVQFSNAVDEDQPLAPGGVRVDSRVDRNASLASPHVIDYGARLLTELSERYPDINGIRLDWPEYPPYHLRSTLFDFSLHARPLLAAQGVDPADYGLAIDALFQRWRQAALAASRDGDVQAVRRALSDAGWDDFFSASGFGAALWASKRAACLNMLRHYRAALDSRYALQPQVFPPPFHRLSGFPLDEALAGVANAVGVKLYTMHWPMIARYWAQDLLGSGATPRQLDAVTATLALFFELVDELPAPETLRYPEPDCPHPVGRAAQQFKLLEAQRLADAVPVTAFVHSYGPSDDVEARFALAAELADAGTIAGGVWINRYGYLSDQKLAMLQRLRRST